MTLAEKFTRLKTSVGGNREKMHFEDTFGMPKEEQAHITRPGRANARILAELEFALHLSEAENGKYDAALEEALDYLLEKQQTEGVLTDQACEEAEEILEPIAEEAKSYELILAAHAHIDMNWMWSFNETVSIVLATFRSILNIMDQYPEFCFSQSQASVYKIVEEYDPELMERIKARIAEGRWEVTASAWVETDKNMPSGESLLRHIQYTREYLSRVWGVKDFDLDFSPDTFGHSANVPEIDQFGGVKYFYHCRGNARRDVLYRYQAPSGKEVLTYREPNWYNGAITPQIGAGFMEIVKKSSGLKTGLVVYGVGDHGGGPTRRDVERALEMQTWKIYPKIRFGTFRDYFHEAEKIREKLFHELKSLSCGYYCGFGIFFQKSRNTGGMIRFHMLYNKIIGHFPTKNLFHIVQPFFGEKAIHCVHNGDFVIQDHIGIVRHSVRNLILSLKQIYLMIVYTHIFYTCTYFHMFPLFPSIPLTSF